MGEVIDIMPRIPIYSPHCACPTQWEPDEASGGEASVCSWSGEAPEDGCCPWCDMPLPDRAWEFLAGA